jgi:hypothetical protein
VALRRVALRRAVLRRVVTAIQAARVLRQAPLRVAMLVPVRMGRALARPSKRAMQERRMPVRLGQGA